MTLEEIIQAKLEKTFSPTELIIENESALHKGHLGQHEASHFRIMMKSSRFLGLSPLERHRLVYACLEEELQSKIHALSLDLRTP
ncbi:MAG: BolA family transcriptional regulator [Leptospiraceae bacterium]|nr:BolA family transcriptional regulator [Leptospiraceae bacterium]MDW8306400.1 BolA family protein [Leptospiraceae bacterium]